MAIAISMRSFFFNYLIFAATILTSHAGELFKVTLLGTVDFSWYPSLNSPPLGTQVVSSFVIDLSVPDLQATVPSYGFYSEVSSESVIGNASSSYHSGSIFVYDNFMISGTAVDRVQLNGYFGVYGSNQDAQIMWRFTTNNLSTLNSDSLKLALLSLPFGMPTRFAVGDSFEFPLASGAVSSIKVEAISSSALSIGTFGDRRCILVMPSLPNARTYTLQTSPNLSTWTNGVSVGVAGVANQWVVASAKAPTFFRVQVKQ